MTFLGVQLVVQLPAAAVLQHKVDALVVLIHLIQLDDVRVVQLNTHKDNAHGGVMPHTEGAMQRTHTNFPCLRATPRRWDNMALREGGERAVDQGGELHAPFAGWRSLCACPRTAPG